MTDPRDDDPVRHETMIIQTGERRSGGGTIVALVVLFALGLLALLYFSGYLGRAADKADVNINVSAPNIELPDVQITPEHRADNRA